MLKEAIKNLRIKHSLITFSGTFFTVLILIFLFQKQIALIEIIKIFLVMLFFSFYSFSSNNYFDRNNDKNNPLKIKSNPIASGELSEMSAIILNALLILITLLITFIWFPSTMPLIISAILIVSIYSYKIKQKPLLDIIFHGYCCLVYFIFPAIITNLGQDLLIAGSLIILSASNIGEIANQLEDYESDIKSNTLTTVGKFGKRTSKYVCLVSSFVFIASLTFLYLFLKIPLILIFSLAPIYKIYSIKNL